MYMNLITPVLFLQKKTDKLCVTTGFNGKISRIRKGGSNCWYMTGPAYWDNQFSARFCELMQKEYDDPGSKDSVGKLFTVIIWTNFP